MNVYIMATMFSLPELRYGYGDLEPFIDAETMEIHHLKHHQSYVNKANDALKGTKWLDMHIFDVIKDLASMPDNIRESVKNSGGGHANHSFFWTVIGPDGGEGPDEALSNAIDSKFGSFDAFKEKFSLAATSLFGSGWAWLAIKNGSLEVLQTSNQDSPLTDGITPILCIDVWEHAYYLKYRNRRPEYVEAFWSVVNWEEVSALFSSAL